jgi:hypothetical protein
MKRQIGRRTKSAGYFNVLSKSITDDEVEKYLKQSIQHRKDDDAKRMKKGVKLAR